MVEANFKADLVKPSHVTASYATFFQKTPRNLMHTEILKKIG